MVTIISDYIPPFSPLPNIAPFTYKDGETYLSSLDNLRVYVNTTLVDFVNTNYATLGSAFTIEINALIATVNTNLANQNTSVDTKIANLTTFVNNSIQAIINNSLTINDAQTTNVINLLTSTTRILLDSLYVSKAIITGAGYLSSASLNATYGAKTTVDNNSTLITSGRLADINLQSEFALKSVETIVLTGRLADANLQAEFALKSIETIVTSGRLSIANMALVYNPLNISGPYASRPAANTVPNGTMYIATNVPEIYLSNGSLWSVIGAGGAELGYAQIVSAFGTSTGSIVDVTGLTTTFIVGERPIEIRFDCEASNATGQTNLIITISLDGSQVAIQVGHSSPTGTIHGFSRRIRIGGLVPGTTHTAKISITAGTAGTNNVISASSNDPAAISVVSL